MKEYDSDCTHLSTDERHADPGRSCLVHLPSEPAVERKGKTDNYYVKEHDSDYNNLSNDERHADPGHSGLAHLISAPDVERKRKIVRMNKSKQTLN